MSVKTVYLKICGRVQGVGFRWWTKRTAKALGGVSGWATPKTVASRFSCAGKKKILNA